MTPAKVKLMVTIYMFSYALGGLLFITPDKYGRKKTILISSLLYCTGMAIAIYSADYVMKSFGLALMGIFHIKTSVAYVYMFESVHSRNKPSCATFINVMDAMPLAVTALILKFISPDILLIQ